MNSKQPQASDLRTICMRCKPRYLMFTHLNGHKAHSLSCKYSYLFEQNQQFSGSFLIKTEVNSNTVDIIYEILNGKIQKCMYHSFVSSKNSGMNTVRYIMIIYLPRNQMRDTDAGRHALTAKCCFALLKSEVHEQHRTRIFVTSGGCHSKESVVMIII